MHLMLFFSHVDSKYVVDLLEPNNEIIWSKQLSAHSLNMRFEFEYIFLKIWIFQILNLQVHLYFTHLGNAVHKRMAILLLKLHDFS